MVDLSKFAEQLDRIEVALSLNKRVLNIEEACKLTGFTKRYIYKLTSEKQIPFSKPSGNTLFFDREKLEEWMLRNGSMSSHDRDTAASTYVTARRHGNLKSAKS